MKDTYTRILPSGLKCVYTRRSGFVGKYAGLGIHYGGAVREYLMDGEYHKTKSGVAHFLEHKAFAMEDGRDALEIFEGMNCQANAYTSREQTIYYFETSDELYPPLSLLLQMVFTPGFTKKNINSEKNIILSELQESMDTPDSRIYDEILSMLYPKSSYKNSVLGCKTDIKNMTFDDLMDAFTAFYRPENAMLSIVADVEPEELFDFLRDEMSRYQFAFHEVKRLPFFQYASPVKFKTIHEDVFNPEVHVSGLLKGFTYKDNLITNLFIALFSNITSIRSSFYKEADRVGLLSNEDISVMVSSSEFGMYFQFDVYTDDPKKMGRMILNKLKSFQTPDVDEQITMQALRDYLCEHIRALDSISYIGDETLSLGLEGADYSLEDEKIRKVSLDDVKALIPSLKDVEYSVLYVYPKNDDFKE